MLASSDEMQRPEAAEQSAPSSAPAPPAQVEMDRARGDEGAMGGAPGGAVDGRDPHGAYDVLQDAPAPEPAAEMAPEEEAVALPAAPPADAFGSIGLGLRGTGSGGGGTGEAGQARRRSARPSRSIAAAQTGANNRYAIEGDERSENRDAEDDAADGDLAERGRYAGNNGRLGYPGTGTIHTTVVTWVHHRPRRCSDAAYRRLADRRVLWRERLARTSSPSEWVEIWGEALHDCEAPSWRDRRALLTTMLARARSVDNMVGFYQLLSDGAARAWLRGQILQKVRTPEELRLVRTAFGLGQAVDQELIERVLARGDTPEKRAVLLRELVEQFPASFDLKLQLLDELERQERIGEARRLANDMRADPLADAGVRTAVGEMFLRVGDEAEARRVFSEIVEFAPLDSLARRRLGDLYRAHGWYEDAYRQYLTLSQIQPHDLSVLLLLAQAAAGAGRVDEALRLEQRAAETAQPGGASGVARTALLWSSVRFAKLRQAAEEADDKRALLARMRRSGVLREAGALRVSLTWSHPDAQLTLWGAHPGLGLSRPGDIAPEYGIEAFDVRESETGTYRFEVRRSPPDHGRHHVTPIEAELVIVWNEGQADEKIEVRTMRFASDRLAYAWTLDDRALAEAAPTELPATTGPRGAR
jgi:Ca-activated chloride channel family protein